MDTPTYASVTDADGFTVSSNMETADAMRSNFGIAEAAPVAVPVAPVEDDEADVNDATPAAVAEPVVEPAKIDKRTKEGRKAAIQAEIDALTKTKYDTQRELDALRAEAEKAQASRKLIEPPPGQITAGRDPEPEPTPDKFQTYEAYVKAQARWEARQEAQAIRAEWAKEQDALAAKQAQDASAKSWRERLIAARTKIPNFDQRLKLDTPMSTPLQDLVKDSEFGPELLLHFSDHPDDAQRLSTLHPIQLIRALGRLEARFEAAPVPTGPAPAPPISQAKPPITPVTASPAIPADTDAGSDDEPFDKHFDRENRRDKRVGSRP